MQHQNQAHRDNSQYLEIAIAPYPPLCIIILLLLNILHLLNRIILSINYEDFHRLFTPNNCIATIYNQIMTCNPAACITQKIILFLYSSQITPHRNVSRLLKLFSPISFILTLLLYRYVISSDKSSSLLNIYPL